jgi:Fe-S cluster assembly iron-binding protein IscA
MGLVQDEPTDSDEVFKEDDFDVIIDKRLLERLGGVRIHSRENRYVGRELLVTPWKPLPNTGCGL